MTTPTDSSDPKAALGLLLLDMLHDAGRPMLLAAVAGLELVVGLSTLDAFQLMQWWLDHHQDECRAARAAWVGGREHRNALFGFDHTEPRWRTFFRN